MAQNVKIKEFPDVANKLTAPSKKSLFERQKAEQEAKRQKEELETAAVYEDFVKSFDDAGDDLPPQGSGGRPPSLQSGPGSLGGAFSKRHFTTSSGPGRGRGSSGPGSLGPSQSAFSRKRAFDGTPSVNRDSKHGMFAYDDPVGPVDAKAAFQTSDDEDEANAQSRAQERAAPKPTLHLSSLPPGTSATTIKTILPPILKVDAVRIIPPMGPSTSDRQTLSALVTLAKDTPAGDLDTVVSSLQNKYLGWGFYLSLSRHLSAAVAGSSLPSAPGMSTNSLPFGAKPINTGPRGNLSRAPPPQSLRGQFAPPASYGPTASSGFRTAPLLQVSITPPSDLKQLKLIHKTVESMVTHGPEFEALLMTRPEVQRDERWAWLWDSTSRGGIWYRWRLWDILTNAQGRMKSSASQSQHIFETGAVWTAPDHALPFEYTTTMEEFVSDSDYNSSDEDDSGDEGRRRLQHLQGGAPIPDNAQDTDTPSYLNPLQKAKLIHLLTRLPTSTGKLRRGDVARITYFAIKHAGAGAEEVVDTMTSNVHNPFSLPSTQAQPSTTKQAQQPEDLDPSVPRLIALYLISDILSSSSTSGVRHAWRYRSLFETSFRSKHTFSSLGRLEKDLSWGRLRAEKWKRSVSSVLALWEGWCCFPVAAQTEFVNEFANPKLTALEEEREREREEEARRMADKGKSKWKTVEAGAKEVAEGEVEAMEEDVDGDPMMEDDEDVDGEPMVEDDDDDLDGEPMMEDEEQAPAAAEEHVNEPAALVELEPASLSGPGQKRQRPKAEDMFADSDDE